MEVFFSYEIGKYVLTSIEISLVQKEFYLWHDIVFQSEMQKVSPEQIFMLWAIGIIWLEFERFCLEIYFRLKR